MESIRMKLDGQFAPLETNCAAILKRIGFDSYFVDTLISLLGMDLNEIKESLTKAGIVEGVDFLEVIVQGYLFLYVNNKAASLLVTKAGENSQLQEMLSFFKVFKEGGTYVIPTFMIARELNIAQGELQDIIKGIWNQEKYQLTIYDLLALWKRSELEFAEPIVGLQDLTVKVYKLLPDEEAVSFLLIRESILLEIIGKALNQ